MVRPFCGAQLDYCSSEIPAIVGADPLSPHQCQPLPDELYLRELRELDLDDANEIARFASQFGRMGLRLGSPGEVPYLRSLVELGPEAYVLLEDGMFGVSIPGLNAFAMAAAMFAKERGMYWAEQGKTFETLYSFSLAAEWIRDLTTIVLQLDEIDGLDGGPRTWESKWLARPTDRMRSLLHLKCGLHALLRPFAPRLSIMDTDEIAEIEQSDELSTELKEDLLGPRVEVPLVSALAMQLYNHLAERASFRTCANEQCGRRFVTHQGRAVHGQNKRTGGGVKYCAYRCSKAQATRNHRKRQKEKESAT